MYQLSAHTRNPRCTRLTLILALPSRKLYIIPFDGRYIFGPLCSIMSTDFAEAEDSSPQADPISPLLALPTEIKSRIAASLHPLDACNLALTHTSLIDIAESVSWRSYTVSRGHPSGSRGPEATLTATPPASGQESIDPNVSAWTDFERSLLARPARYKHIHILSYTLAPQAIPIAARILPKLSHLLELEQCCNPQEQSVAGDDERGSSFSMLLQCGSLVSVKTVKLHKANGDRNDLFNALHALPNVAELWAVTLLPLKSGIPGVEPPELPHLERIVLGARSLPKTLGPIASRAPRMSTVEVVDSPGRPGEPFKQSTHLDTLLRSETIRNISLNGEMWKYLRKADRRLHGWLPNLETLCLPCAVSGRPLKLFVLTPSPAKSVCSSTRIYASSICTTGRTPGRHHLVSPRRRKVACPGGWTSGLETLWIERLIFSTSMTLWKRTHRS